MKIIFLQHLMNEKRMKVLADASKIRYVKKYNLDKRVYEYHAAGNVFSVGELGRWMLDLCNDMVYEGLVDVEAIRKAKTQGGYPIFRIED